MAGEEKPWSKDWLIARWNKGLRGVKRRINAFADSLLRRKHPSVSYRFLAQQIEGRFADDSGSRTIVFSSADPQDISTETLLTIAYYLHDELGKKVLLVDGSFGLSDLSDRLDSLRDEGLSEYLYEPGHTPASLIKPVVDEGVYLLPRGKYTPKGSRHVKRETVSALLTALGEFDYVLIQQNAITMDTRYLVFAQEADLVLLYIEERLTLVSELEANQKALKEYEIENIGFLMSGAG